MKKSLLSVALLAAAFVLARRRPEAGDPRLRRRQPDRVAAGARQGLRGEDRREGRRSPSAPRAISRGRSRPALRRTCSSRPTRRRWTRSRRRASSGRRTGASSSRTASWSWCPPTRRVKVAQRGRPREPPEDRHRGSRRGPGRRLREEVADGPRPLGKDRAEGRPDARRPRVARGRRERRGSGRRRLQHGCRDREDPSRVAFAVTNGPEILYSLAPVAASKNPTRRGGVRGLPGGPGGARGVQEARLRHPRRPVNGDRRRLLGPAPDAARGGDRHAADPAARNRRRLAPRAPRRGGAHAARDPAVAAARAAADGGRPPAARSPAHARAARPPARPRRASRSSSPGRPSSSRRRSCPSRSSSGRRAPPSRRSTRGCWRWPGRSAAGPPRSFAASPCPWRGAGSSRASLLAFSRALGEFGATIMIAGSIPGRTQTMALAIFQRTHIGQDDAAMRLVGVTVVLAFAAVWTTEILTRRRSKRTAA